MYTMIWGTQGLKNIVARKTFFQVRISQQRKKNRINPKCAHSLQTKPTNTLPYVHFSSYHPPAQKREFTQGNVPRLLRAHSSEKTFEKNINNPIEIQSEVLSQRESCIVYNLSLLIFALHSFQIANSLSPILQVFPSSSLLLFGRFFFSFNIRFKVTNSGFKLILH